MEITQTLLPGVGMRYDMTTTRGVPLSLVVHREGQADLCVLSRDDPDDVRLALSLDDQANRDDRDPSLRLAQREHRRLRNDRPRREHAGNTDQQRSTDDTDDPHRGVG